MSEVNILDLLIPVGSTYIIWLIIMFIFDITRPFGWIVSFVIVPILAFAFMPVTTATTLVSLTYLVIVIILILNLFLATFGRKYPYKVEDIDINDIKLSNENLQLYNESCSVLDKLPKKLEKVKNLDITKRQDGHYNERSKAGKEANDKWNELESEISYAETAEMNSRMKQLDYVWNWNTVQTVRYRSNVLIASFVLSLICVFIISFFYKADFFIQQYILENSQINWLSNFDNNYVSLLELSGTITLFAFSLLALIFDSRHKSNMQHLYTKRNQLIDDLNNGIYSESDKELKNEDVDDGSYLDLDNVKNLLESGENINKQDDENQFSILHYACINGNIETVKYLIDNGANIDIQGRKQWTPLYRAIVDNQPAIALYLIEHGANVNLKDSDGWTPLHRSIRDNHLEIAKNLVENGADINAQNNKGWTPLHRAIVDEYLDFTQYLIDNGADLDLINNNGESPFDFIEKKYGKPQDH